MAIVLLVQICPFFNFYHTHKVDVESISNLSLLFNIIITNIHFQPYRLVIHLFFTFSN